MGKAMNFFGVGALAVTIIALLFFMQPKHNISAPSVVTIGSTAVRVDVADTPGERMQGLSGRQILKDGEGMLFIFEEDGSQGMWMKDMHFSIDIIWAKSDGTIITIEKKVSPETYPNAFYASEPTARYVLEVPAGFAERHGIAEGQKLVVQ